MNGSPQSVKTPRRRKLKPADAGDVPLARGCLAEGSLPVEIAAIIRQAAERIDVWTPKGVHFGWEKAFKNKGKFPASMTKPEARVLVRRVLLQAPLKVFANRREGLPAHGEFRIVADAGGIIGTRGQRALRIVLSRDSTGYVIDNAFPVVSA